MILGGIALPIAAIAFELAERAMTWSLDPIPTYWHLLLLALVPISNGLALWAIQKSDWRRGAPLSFALGISIGVSLYYSVIFLPMSPFFAIGVIIGLGLLGLSPYFALASSIVCYRRLARLWPLENARRRIYMWTGIAIAALVLVGFALSQALTIHYLKMASSDDRATSERGVKLLRTWGSEAVLLRACYELPANYWTDPFSDNPNRSWFTTEQARTVYYKVTGNSFNSVPRPRLALSRASLEDSWEWDPDLGGTAVNGMIRNLSMSTSRMDAVVDPDAMTAYTEWTMIFTNSSSVEREARAEIALPHGAAVSRLTLWVNGEPREAAFSSRGKVRQAYQEVAVVQRQDPVLVTTCGPDRVLMQCFPVPANGGTMKVRLGITSPLTPRSSSEALYTLPRIIDRNFAIKEQVQHSLFVESAGEIALTGEKPRPGARNVVRALMSDEDFSSGASVMVCSRRSDVHTVWSPDVLEPDRYAVVQTLAPSQAPTPRNVIMVLDSSATMAEHRDDIARAMQYMPQECRFQVLAAGEDVTELCKPCRALPEALERAGERISNMRCVGGIDNREALIMACDAAVELKDSVVLWIHGPQPLASTSHTEQLLQLWQRRPKSLHIISLAVSEGSNTVLADLERTGAVEVVPRTGSLSDDLKMLFTGWKDDSRLLVLTRKRVPISQAVGKKVSQHVARLWARDETMRLLATGDDRQEHKASVFAVRHQLVTAVSGAVVLENDQQYKENGLEPVDASTVPSTVPEPGTWLALATGTALLAGSGIRRRLQSAKKT